MFLLILRDSVRLEGITLVRKSFAWYMIDRSSSNVSAAY